MATIKSIEEKAKRYDEAIEIAKEINNEQRAQPFNVMTRVFPELKESEDERIRNFISNELACLRATEGKGSDRYEELTNAIAWLENQSETFIKKDVDDAYLKGICDAKHELEKQVKQETVSKVKIGEKYRCSNSARYTCFQIGKVYEVKDSFDAAMISLCSDCFVLVDDSVEQKPADITDEWIEEYWQHEKVNNPYSYNKGDEIQFDYQGFVSFCKKYCQNHAWREEDKRKINRIYSILRQAADTHAFSTSCRLIGNKECIELQDFLKSLKDRVGCEVNCTTTKEWSEEDEVELEETIYFVKEFRRSNLCCNESLLQNANTCIEWLENKLKFIKPQNRWKPTEEQLKALNKTIHASNFGLDSERKRCLESLYEQLKKL